MNILKERERADERNDYDFRTDYYTARREDAFERSMRDRGYDDLRTDYSRRDDLDRRGYSDRRYDMADLGARRDYDVRERDCDVRGREYEDYAAPRYDYRDSYRSDDDSEYRYEQRSSFSPIEYSVQVLDRGLLFAGRADRVAGHHQCGDVQRRARCRGGDCG